MYKETISLIEDSAKHKCHLYEQSLSSYLLHSAMAGAYVALGIVLILVIGSPLYAVHSPYISIAMGLSFGIALSLVFFAGSDLFTGNTMVLPIAALSGSLKWNKVFKMFLWNYLGNLLGSLGVALLVYYAGVFDNIDNSHFLNAIAVKKMGLSFEKLFFRGMLCNWLVTLSVWCYYRMKTETGKLIMVFWCLFAFITSGYEHSVANMSLLSLANLAINTSEVSISGMIHNLIPVTLGNMASGTILMGISYSWISGIRTVSKKKVF